MRYLLDTNIVSDLVRNPAGLAAKRIAEVGERSVCTSIIVAAELRFGAAKKRSTQLSALIDGVLSRLDVAPFDAPAEVIYGDLRARLEAGGTPVGSNDVLIAAHALALGCTIVTNNVREFVRIDGLPLEDWLKEQTETRQ